jgi:uncharacterized protein (UPF0128 family)
MKTKTYIKWEDRKAKQPKIPSQLISRLGKPVKTVNVCTLNSWGFDGWIGTSTKFSGDISYEVGKIGTRHQGTFPKKVVNTGIMKFEVEDFCEGWDNGCRTSHDFYKFRYPN